MTGTPENWPARATVDQRAAFTAFAERIASAEREAARLLAAEAPRYGVTITEEGGNVHMRGANLGVCAGTLTGALTMWRTTYQDNQP